jgi:hypothetical protein
MLSVLSVLLLLLAFAIFALVFLLCLLDFALLASWSGCLLCSRLLWRGRHTFGPIARDDSTIDKCEASRFDNRLESLLSTCISVWFNVLELCNLRVVGIGDRSLVGDGVVVGLELGVFQDEEDILQAVVDLCLWCHLGQ